MRAWLYLYQLSMLIVHRYVTHERRASWLNQIHCVCASKPWHLGCRALTLGTYFPVCLIVGSWFKTVCMGMSIYLYINAEPTKWSKMSIQVQNLSRLNVSLFTHEIPTNRLLVPLLYFYVFLWQCRNLKLISMLWFQDYNFPFCFSTQLQCFKLRFESHSRNVPRIEHQTCF